MLESDYKALSKRQLPKKKPRTLPLPKATEKYLEAEESFARSLDNLGIKHIKKFQFKTTKHWRFDFLLIEQRILVEIAGGSWSGGRGGRLKNKAWSMDRYDHAEAMGYTVVRIESANRYKIIETGLMQIESSFTSTWLKRLKRQIFNGTDQTIPTTELD